MLRRMLRTLQGLSWDVIQQLAVHFDLHPLSVEDVVHIPQRIKAEYYPVRRALQPRLCALHAAATTVCAARCSRYCVRCALPVPQPLLCAGALRV